MGMCLAALVSGVGVEKAFAVGALALGAMARLMGGYVAVLPYSGKEKAKYQASQYRQYCQCALSHGTGHGQEGVAIVHDIGDRACIPITGKIGAKRRTGGEVA